MLRNKLEEIEVYNHALPQSQNKSERHKRYICFEYGIRGHIAINCPNKGKNTEVTDLENISKTPHTQIIYPENIHLPTDFMIEGTNEEEWDKIWYISKQLDRHVCINRNLFAKLKEKFSVEKLEDLLKLLFIHGVGEVHIRIGSEIMCIPGVLYTPDVTLNILSVSQLEAQGLDLTFKGNRCKPVTMFKNPTDCFFDQNKMNLRQNM